MVNQGIIQSDTGQHFRIDVEEFINQGTVALLSGIITLDGGWHNAGVFRVDDGTLSLDGNFLTSDIGIIDRTGGTINIIGFLDNTGDTLRLDGDTGDYGLLGGTINGGTIELREGASLSPGNNANNTLDGVFVDGDLTISESTARLNLNGVLINGDFNIINASAFRKPIVSFYDGFTISGTLMIDGDLTIEVEGSHTFSGTVDSTANSDSSVTVHVFGTGAFTFTQTTIWTAERLNISGVAGTTLVNQGTIQVAASGKESRFRSFSNQGQIKALNGVLFILDGQWENLGTITLDGSTLFIRGNFTPSQIGTIIRNGETINIVGVMDNTGNTFRLDGNTGDYRLLGGTILGGILELRDGANLSPGNNDDNKLQGVYVDGDLTMSETSADLILDGVFMNGDLHMSGTSPKVRLFNGFTISGTLMMSSASSIINFEGSQTFSGTLDATENPDSLKSVSILGDGAVVTFTQNTNWMAGTMEFREVLGNQTLVNLGTLSANISGKRLYFRSEEIYNYGTMQALDGGYLEFKYDLVNHGLLSPGTASSPLDVNGTFTQTISGTLKIDIGGSDAGSDYSQINADHASLDGTLAISMTNNYDPEVGLAFDFLTHTTRSGTFSQVNGLKWTDGKIFLLSYEANGVRLTVGID